MSVYLITYDLNAPGKDYGKLYEEIKSLGAWAHYMESVWFVDTDLDPNSIRDKLKEIIDSNDSLFVSKVTSYSGWADKKLWDWLSKHV
ncbi:hypothetical protein [Heyndrickxia ginsengihumi]|uniref:hypothetical protein n=1 Tax=Heyndrickxia ginsengihumi TaxID=363870 RepID=UPI003D19F172